MRFTTWLVALLALGCAAGSGTSSDAGADARVEASVSMDAAGPDAVVPPDAWASSDANVLDAEVALDGGSPFDAALALDAPLESDAFVAVDAFVEPNVLLQCAPRVGDGAGGGLAISDEFWGGFRFEVTSGSLSTTSVGLTARSLLGTSGTIFAAIVALTSSADFPDSSDLSSADVLGTVLIAVPSDSDVNTLSSSLSLVLPAGHYAVMFGGNAFGASTGLQLSAPSGTTAPTCDDGGSPFSYRQSDGALFVQAASPHFFVTGLL